MKASILQKLLITFLGFGFFMGIVFPFFASIFVEFKEGYFIWFSISCLIAGGIIGLSNYFLLQKLLVNKLKHVAKVSNAISNHDLTAKYVLESDDVIGEIINSFNKMSNTLREIVNELKNSSDLMHKGVDQICIVSNNTNQEIQQQHNQTQDILLSIENLVQTSQQVSDKAQQATESASLAKTEADKGSAIVEQTVNSISNLASAVETASESINRLEIESTNIGSVLDVIHGISEQTNLLALNAAIEAARAGEQGRGFAVVADEVRTLAQRTNESTTEIQNKIETLQTVSRDTVKVMSEGQSQASESVKTASEAGQSLNQISQSVQAITELNQQITDEASSQTGFAMDINQQMQAVAQIANNSMRGVEDTGTESRNLDALTKNLQQLVGKFRL